MAKSGPKKKTKKKLKLAKTPAILEELKKSEKDQEKPLEQPKPEPLHLQVMRAKLSQLLTDEERDDLAEVLMLPGFKVQMKIARLLQADWGDQLINANYRHTNHDLISNFVVDAQGMKRGLVAYFRMMALYRKAIQKAEKEKRGT